MPGKGKTKRPKLDLNIFPGNWTVTNDRMFKAFDLSFAQNWNPATFP